MRLIGFLAEKESSEAEERAAWEFYLHKVSEGSYADFAAALHSENAAEEELPAATAHEIAARSNDILRRTQPGE